MSKIHTFIFLLFCFLFMIFVASGMDEAMAIIDKVDANTHFSSVSFKGQMMVKRSSNELKKTMQVWAKGEDFFIVFTNTEDKDVKYLRKDGNIYVYFPDADDVITISKSVLRQGFMGSDISYDDMTRNRKLSDDYAVESFETINENGKTYYLINLKAVAKDVSYYRQVLKIDAEHYLAVETKLYDLSDRLVKSIVMENFELIQDRYFPIKTSIIDGFKKSYVTVFEHFDLKFDIPIDSQLFTIKNLYK